MTDGAILQKQLVNQEENCRKQDPDGKPRLTLADAIEKRTRMAYELAYSDLTLTEVSHASDIGGSARRTLRSKLSKSKWSVPILTVGSTFLSFGLLLFAFLGQSWSWDGLSATSGAILAHAVALTLVVKTQLQSLV